MSENINNNIKNNINPENIETIDFDELDKLNETNEVKETKEIEEVGEIKGVVESDNDGDIIKNIEDIENAEITGTNDSLGFSLPPLSFQEQIENDEFLKEAYERVERDREKIKNLVSLDKLGELKEGEVKYLQIGDACIEVKNKISYAEVFDSVQTAIALVLDDKTYISEPLKEMLGDIQILRSYTNLDFRFFDTLEFDPNELYSIYGLLIQEDVFNKVKNLIDKKQLDFWFRAYNNTLESIVAYRNSAMGIITSLQQKESEAGTGLEQALSNLKDAENQEAIQNMLKLMGLDDQAANAVIQLAGEVKD